MNSIFESAAQTSLKLKAMQALRQILDVKGHSLNIRLPDDFTANKVEVIILSLEENTRKKRIASLRGKLNLSDVQYSDFQKDVKKTKLPDAIIAATALVNDLTIITRNIKDFDKIEGLEVLNP
jgi:predicted nucleic acid-binding protein